MVKIKNPMSGGGGAGGSEVINGIIEQYKAESGTIDANTFVEFVNAIDPGTHNIGEDTEIVASSVQEGTVISAVALDSSTVFIAHSRSGTGTNADLYGIVCKISGRDIVVGADTAIRTSSYAGRSISAVALNSSTVFIAHSDINVYGLYGIVCTISGTTITVGTNTALTSTTYHSDGSVVSVVALNSSTVFVAHSHVLSPGSGNNSLYLYGVVCTISGTTITVGTDTSVSTQSDSGAVFSVTALNSSAVFIGYYLLGVVCTISGTTITVGNYKSLGGGTNVAISAVALDNSTVFIARSGDNRNLLGVVCTISGTTITVGTSITLSNMTGSGKVISAVALDNSTVFIAHAYSDYIIELKGLDCTVSGTNITIGEDVRMVQSLGVSNLAASATLFAPSGGVFIAHNYGADSHLYGLVCSASGTEVVKKIQVASNPDAIQGLTKTTCTDTAAGDVWVLNTSQGE